MRRLVVFNHVSLDGSFVDARGGMGFAHGAGPDPEWDEFSEGNARGGGTLLFGRVTYALMAGFWPSPSAAAQMPVLAERMNALPKIVFSRTLKEASWANTRLLGGDLLTEIRRLKQEPGEDLVILGSGTLVAQLAPHGLIDEFQLVVNPVVLGGGRTLFEGLPEPRPLTLVRTRTFRNGKVLLCHVPADVPAEGSR